MASLGGVTDFLPVALFEFEDSVLARLCHSAGLYMIGLGLEGRRQTGASKLHTLYIQRNFSRGHQG